MSQFGQPPLAAFLPLRAGQNLSDLPDKPAALANLGTLSTSDIMMNSVPIGTIIPFWGNTAPVGYLPCNGQTVNSGTFPDLVTFLGGGSSQALPDLRGEFLRGWDNGRGTDLGRAIKTAQADALKNHFHYLPTESGAGSTFDPAGIVPTIVLKDAPADWVTRVASDNNIFGTPAGTVRTYSQSADVETRPRNISVLYCMKAYGALVNTSTANIGNVLTELSQCTKLTQFEVSLSGNGYQKFPNGLIMQWGTTYINATTGSVTFPIVFPSACTSVMTNKQTTSDARRTSTSAATTAGFSIYGWSGASAANIDTAYWMAIGY
jgi:microcystin-dependent protein